MKEDIINSLIKAGILTSIIALLVIFFGNTGSGFFSNLMIFIVSVFVGTPFAIIGQKLGGMFAFLGRIFSDNGNLEIFRHIGFMIGALIGVAVGVWIFSNKTEVGFMSSCYKNVGDKKICECIYDKVEPYTTKEQIELVTNPNYKNKLTKLYTSCKVVDNVVAPQSHTIPNVVTQPTTSVSPARKTKYVDSSASEVDRFFSKSEKADMGCEAGTVRYEGQCILEMEFLKIMESLKQAPTPKTTKSEPSPDVPPINSAVVPEEELEDLNCPFDNQVMRNGKCVDFLEVNVLKKATGDNYKVITVAHNDTLNVRSDPYATSHNRVAELLPDAKNIKVIKCTYNSKGTKWCQINHSDYGYSISGWVIARCLSRQEKVLNSVTYKVIKVASNDTLSVRDNAGTRNKKIGDLAYDSTSIKVIKCKNVANAREWCKVSHPSIISGWVRSKYLKKE